MGFFSIFTRKNTKNTVSQPAMVTDYSHHSNAITRLDGTSFACMDRIAAEFASLNYAIYNAKDRQKVKKHHLYNVLKHPNSEDSHFNFFYQSAIDYFNGGCFWFKAKVNDEVIALFRLNPLAIRIQRDAYNNKRIYCYNGKQFTDADIIYIPSRFNYSTLLGGSSIFNSIPSVFDTASNLDSFTQSTFENGLQGKRIVMDIGNAYPNITPEQIKEIKASFQSEYAGAENASRPLLKLKGIEYSELGASADNRAAELTENRKFQEHEIAKIFGVPEGLLTVSKDSDLENIFTLFSEFAIRPLATQFVEAINSMLDEEECFFDFDYNGILKVNLSQRIDAYTKQIGNGLMSPNEARGKENLPPIEAGDNHFMPVNLMPLNDETIDAYMAKQKNEMQSLGDGAINPTDENSQHFGGGDDKQ